MFKNASISNCGQFRYHLYRQWDEDLPEVMFIMLNPSTADGDVDDPTIRRCIGFAKSWGYGAIHVCNLYAFRATNPKDLFRQESIIGTGDINIKTIEYYSSNCDEVICAWGNHPIISKIKKLMPNYNPLQGVDRSKLMAIQISNYGTPKHPLYLRSSLRPIKFKL